MKKIILAMIICFGIFISGEKNSEAAELYDVIYQNILYCNGDKTESQQITDAIFYAAAKCEVDPILITSVMEAESNFHFDSYSNAGAIGLMQIMPETAQAVGMNPYDFFKIERKNFAENTFMYTKSIIAEILKNRESWR